jgi:hypothetical protein
VKKALKTSRLGSDVANIYHWRRYGRLGHRPVRWRRSQPANPMRTSGLLGLRKGSHSRSRKTCAFELGNQFSTILGYCASMGTPTDHAGKRGMRARKRSAALLEVWLELLDKIEGPRRRRAAEFRRRRDNPIRRVPNRSSRTFGALR